MKLYTKLDSFISNKINESKDEDYSKKELKLRKIVSDSIIDLFYLMEYLKSTLEEYMKDSSYRKLENIFKYSNSALKDLGGKMSNIDLNESPYLDKKTFDVNLIKKVLEKNIKIYTQKNLIESNDDLGAEDLEIALTEMIELSKKIK